MIDGTVFLLCLAAFLVGFIAGIWMLAGFTTSKQADQKAQDALRGGACPGGGGSLKVVGGEG